MAITTPAPQVARTARDWCTLEDAGGFDVNLKPVPYAFVALAAGTVQLNGSSNNTMPLVVAANERVEFAVKKFVASGTTLTDTQIWVLY